MINILKISIKMYSTRKARGKTQNIFLIEMNVQSDKEKIFMVMGTTGNVYKVIIKSKPECNCPDFQTRGNRCKHIYFILLRVMHINNSNEDQEIFDENELKTMFASMPQFLNHLIVDDVHRSLYNDLKNKSNNIKIVDQKSTDDICPICLDDLDNLEELDYCKYSCGKPIHKTCFSMWMKKNNTNCVFCRGSWILEEKDYVNLLIK